MGQDSPRLFASEQWERIKRVFDEVSQLPPDRHAAAVTAATTDDEVRREVAALLAIHVEAGDFLERPAAAAIAAGDRIGPYEIIGELGRGGMGAVYRARDSRLGRDVAIKVLRDGPTTAATRARFVREARAIAAISHANVLALFDVGDHAGAPYLVTELIEGETLRARLERGVPPLADALAWTQQIARGLAAAHDRGIVHRDLKPANVMLVEGGELKLVDFGLARSPLPGGEHDISMPGAIVGTVGYLAPEQARGQPTAPTADLFALGAILFELLTGRRAFPGDTLVDTLRAVLDDEPPPPSSIRPDVPAWLDRVVARCLAKDVANRFQSARDLAFVLDAAVTPIAVARSPRRRWPLVAGAGILGALALTLVCSRTPREAAPPQPARPFMLTHSGRDRHPAVSPDGKFLAFTSDRDGSSRIWLQQIATGRETPLTAGRDSAPRFSRNGEVLFTRTSDDGKKMLFRVGVLGGEPRKIADDASDGDWSPDGRQVVFVRARRTATRAEHSVVTIDLDGAKERVIGELDRDRVSRGRDAEQHVRWSPDGTRIAVSGRVRHPGTPQAVVILPVAGGAPIRFPAPSREGLVSAVAWENASTLLYLQASSISGSSTGGVARVVRQHVGTGEVTTLWWSLETATVLDIWPGRGVVMDVRSTRQNLVERVRRGESRRLSTGPTIDRQPILTPDGSRIVFTSNRGGGLLDLWMFDRRTGDITRLTDHAAEDYDPAVTPDGRGLVWSSNRTGVFEIWMANLDGTDVRQLTHGALGAENPGTTPDGAFTVYTSGGSNAGVWRTRSDGTEPTMLVPDAILPEVSPDGVHVAFVSNRDPARPTVGVARVADGTVLPFTIPLDVRARTPVLLGRSRWSPDGKSIAFVGQNARGYTGLYLQSFDPGAADTKETRIELAGFSSESDVESFDFDDDVVIVAEAENRTGILAVTVLPP